MESALLGAARETPGLGAAYNAGARAHYISGGSPAKQKLSEPRFGRESCQLTLHPDSTHLAGVLTQVAAFSVNDRGVRIENRRGAHRQRKLSANAVLVPFLRSNHRARAKRRNHWQFVAKPATLRTSGLRGSP